MFGVRHNLVEEFSEYKNEMSYLKHRDSSFSRLLDSYNQADKTIYGYEQLRGPVDDTYMGTLKMSRVKLKDQIYRKLQTTHARAF